MVPKWTPNRPKFWLFHRLSLEVFFSGLKSLLKLIFASTSGLANLKFCNTLHCFWRLFRLSEDRVENDFELIFDLPTAPKNLSKSANTGSRNSKKSASKKDTIFHRYVRQNCFQKRVQKSINVRKNGWGTFTEGTFGRTNHANNRFWTLQSRFWLILKRSGSHFGSTFDSFCSKLYQNPSRLARRNARSDWIRRSLAACWMKVEKPVRIPREV